MRTRAAIVLILVAAFAALLPLAQAGAGGFCMGHVGSESFTDTDGTKVSLTNDCFSPTVIRVGSGDTVTWTNKDKEMHAVGGAVGSFGDAHGEIAPGESVSYRFDQEGTFPYVCVYHPGMAGAVVVGDGEGPAFKAGGIVSSAPEGTDDGTSASAEGPATVPTAATSSDRTSWLLLAGLLGAAGALAGLLKGWGRRNHADPT